MKVKRGDIVLVPVPFSSGTGGKVRPALVVQADRNNRRLDDTIVALITSTTHRAGREPTQLLIDITTAEGQQSGLLQTSAVRCEHLATLEQSLIIRVIGSLPPSLMSQVDACLKVALALS
jgi:mRNA interferase MazF